MRRLVVPILVSVIAALALLLAFQNTSGPAISLPDGGDFIPLTVPPAAAQVTPVLDTSTIGMLSYLQRSRDWVLADTVPAFISFTDGGNFYDGVVRVWDSGTIGAESPLFIGDADRFVDINVRVRADGWILAWLDRTQDEGGLVYWGSTQVRGGNPPDESTSLGRAIGIIYEVASVAPEFSYSNVGYYDYSKTDATRLFIFGRVTFGTTPVIYFYTIPPGAMVGVDLQMRIGGIAASGRTHTVSLDGVTLASLTAPSTSVFEWQTFDVPSRVSDWSSTGIQHGIEQSASTGGRSKVAFIMWTR